VLTRTISDVSGRGAKSSGRRFNPIVFIIASFAAAALLVAIVAIPQWLSKQARWEVLRSHVGEMAQSAASVLDGDLHRQLLDAANYSDELYARAVKPLVHFHSANPDIFYVYTMVDREGVPYFVLDTAASPELRTHHQLRASGYMEHFRLRTAYKDNWLAQIAAGKTYVTPTYEQDDYGNFLTAHAPIYDSQGRYSGFVGVDFDLQYYLAEEARFRAIEIGSLAAALMMALVIGYLAEVYHSDLHRRIQEHHHSSIRDGLTGLLNRRGAMDAVDKSLARHAPSYATLLLDIDNLKMINDRQGHVTGDAVIARTAEALRQSIREGDECARLGGDEFLIFAADCDTEGAEEIARRILARLSTQEESLADARFSVSIGISVQGCHGAKFDQMFRNADAALYHAKAEGKSCIAIFAPFMTAAFQPDRSSSALTE
jgi:diguanylate cyclase (GGDEF)-like protein